MTRKQIRDIRRQELEKAAYETISQLGFKGMTLKEVAKRAGVSKGVIHHYFASKEELIEGMVRHTNRVYAKATRGRLKTARSASQRIWAIIESNLVEEYYEPKLIDAYLPTLVAGIHHEKLFRTYNAIDIRGRSNIQYALKVLIPADALAATYIIWNMLEGAWTLSSQLQTTRTALLETIADYLIHIPGFDISVIDLKGKSKSSDVQRTGRVAISTIRRMELEQAALNILYEDGFRELTVQRVAEKAQLSKGVVHHYFLSKDDLAAGAMRHEYRAFGLAVTQLLAKTNSPSERVWTVITTQLAEPYLQVNSLRWYLNSQEAGFRNPGIARIYNITERRGRSNIAFALKQLMPAADARRMTWSLWSMIEGACFLMFSDRAIKRKNVLLGMAHYLTSSIPAFDPSVLVIEGASAYKTERVKGEKTSRQPS